MTETATTHSLASAHPVDVYVDPALDHRDRLTTAFRVLLAIPHLILVGGPMAAALSWTVGDGTAVHLGGGGGLLGAVAAICAVIAWFAILFTGRHPDGLWKLSVYYLSWRIRAVAYVTLLRDEYPPFGDGDYAAQLHLPRPTGPRNRLTVAFRLLLAIPHICVVWVLSLVWAVVSMIAWFAILFTGSYPRMLYDFALGVLRWNTRVEAYLLLLHDEYPPFTLG